MKLTPLTAISPTDGRYFKKTQELHLLCSEYGLFRLRVWIEICWLICLAENEQIKEIKALSQSAQEKLESIYHSFTIEDAQQIKNIELTTNHDIKAVEYFLKEKIKGNSELEKSIEFIHFACTSEDINNLAYALMLQEARQACLLPTLNQLMGLLKSFAHAHADLPMLGHTHGQPAVTTTLGKEIANFVSRLEFQINSFSKLILKGKFNGAIGNYNAHLSAYPDVDWLNLTKNFVEKLGLNWNVYTTQIEPHDTIAEYFDILTRINTILIDLAADCWGYISLGYLKQKIIKEEIGSSTMPHKVNPIDFENAEGNLGFANCLNQYFSRTLPISRWQRDLRDSTLLRNLGVALAHSLIGYKSLLIGLNKIEPDATRMAEELDVHWEIIAEAIQTTLRRYGIEAPYEKLKKLTHGKILTQESLQKFINSLDLPPAAKQQLLQLTPFNYLGYAAKLAQLI